jgi:hypothetical protein
MLTTRIIGSSGQQLKVNGEGEIGVVVHTHPPIKESRVSLPFRDYFKNAGSNDMKVSGTLAAPVEFSIDADANFDYYIKTLSVKLADAGATFDDFGNLSGALTNGVEFYWQSVTLGKLVIHDGIKDNLEFYRLSTNQVANNSIIDLSGGGADAVVVSVDLVSLFGNPWGVRLQKDTTDKLVFSVRDNVSGVDEFNIIGYGTKV